MVLQSVLARKDCLLSISHVCSLSDPYLGKDAAKFPHLFAQAQIVKVGVRVEPLGSVQLDVKSLEIGQWAAPLQETLSLR